VTKARDLANSVNSGTIPGTRLENDAITASKMAPNSVDSSELANDAVSTGKIQNSAITTVKVADGAITVAKVTGGPVFRAGQGTAFSVANSTWTKVTFGAEESDTASCYASNRFTPTVAGYYQLNAAAQYQGTTTAALFGIAISKNGSFTSQGVGLETTLYARSLVSDILYLNGTTDYVEIFILHSQGTAQNCLGDYFSGCWLRP
jgi:hypothetical protein